MVVRAALVVLSLVVVPPVIAACGDGEARPPTDVGDATADDARAPDAPDAPEATDTADDAEVGGGRAPERTLAIMAALGAEPCEGDASFLCATVDMPLDHAAPDGPTLPWRFAVRPADVDPPRGLLVTIVGGPGDAGTEALDDYGTVGARFRRELDLAYFDLRGVGGSDDRRCPEAATALWDGGMHVASEAGEAALRARAATFASACPAEMGLGAEQLAAYSTLQAADDLEAMRGLLEHDTLRLYGLSYGTQLGQVYAHRYPARVDALAIDGVVDLTSSLLAFDVALAEAVNGLLERTLTTCDADPDCGEALGIGAERAWDDLAASLPVDVDYTVDGQRHTATLTVADLDAIAASYVGDPDDRRELLDLLIAVVAADDWEALREAAFWAEARDDDGTQLEPDETLGAYHLLTCADYGQPDAAAWSAAGRAFWEARVSSTYYGDVPCLAWPVALGSMPAVATLSVPLLVVNSDADAATPHAGGVAVAARNPAAGVIEVTGGGHVMYGYGNACVDDAVNAFLLDGALPAARPLACTDVFVAP